jgi:hypothetical protein
MRTRRRFLRALAAPPATPTPLLGDTPPGPAAEALADVVRHRYGAQLEPADLEEIKKAIEGNLQAADRAKNAVPLGHADEPVTIFEARSRGRARAAEAPARPPARG